MESMGEGGGAMILVTGGTGNVGRALVHELREMRASVRVLTRDAAKARLPGDVELAEGDLTLPATWRPALAGVEAVFLVREPGGDAILDELQARGVGRVVLLSSGAAALGEVNAIARGHLETERRVRSCGVPWTFLRPGAFMTNVLQWAAAVSADGVVREPFGDVATAPIDPTDIAAVAARELLAPGEADRIHDLTGPEALTARQQVAILGDVLGRTLRFEDVPEEVARAAMGRFAPPEIVAAKFGLMRHQRETPARVTDTVASVTGRPARTFRQWAQEHRGAFA